MATAKVTSAARAATKSLTVTLGDRIVVAFGNDTWTGRDIQKVLAALPNEYARYQRERLRKASGVAQSTTQPKEQPANA